MSVSCPTQDSPGNRDKSFPTLVEAALVLQELGVDVQTEERERLERAPRKDRWTLVGAAHRGDATLSAADYDVFFIDTQ